MSLGNFFLHKQVVIGKIPNNHKAKIPEFSVLSFFFCKEIITKRLKKEIIKVSAISLLNITT